MQITQETLINPLVDISLIPVDISRFLYDMPYLDMEDEQASTLLGESVYEERAVGIKTMDDIRYEMILSFVHNNALIGF